MVQSGASARQLQCPQNRADHAQSKVVNALRRQSRQILMEIDWGVRAGEPCRGWNNGRGTDNRLSARDDSLSKPGTQMRIRMGRLAHGTTLVYT